MVYLALSLLFLLLCVAVLFVILKSRNMHLWIVSYIRSRRKRNNASTTKHIYVAIADHYEPYFKGVSPQIARGLVDDWIKNYEAIASKYQDSDGNHPQHSYFYPIEEYDEYILSQLQLTSSRGFGDIDIHLHHDNDTAENLEKTLNEFKQLLQKKHQLLRYNEQGELVYGFIHGNWALANSRPDGRWCGVNNEIDVLLKTGCVYDMTMPSAPSDTQTRTINSIYWAQDTGCAKSHNVGEPAQRGRWYHDRLLMIQGPLMLNWKNRKFGLIPKIESGELSGDAPPSEQRLALWEAANVCVNGVEQHIFIKLHTHGLQQKNIKMFFEDGGFETLWQCLSARYVNQPGYQLHFVNTWQMYEKIKNLIQQTS